MHIEEFKDAVDGMVNDLLMGECDERGFKDNILDLLLEVCIERLQPKVDSVSTNSAMVPCPHFKNERTCPIQFNAICGLNPCLIDFRKRYGVCGGA